MEFEGLCFRVSGLGFRACRGQGLLAQGFEGLGFRV